MFGLVCLILWPVPCKRLKREVENWRSSCRGYRGGYGPGHRTCAEGWRKLGCSSWVTRRQRGHLAAPCCLGKDHYKGDGPEISLVAPGDKTRGKSQCVTTFRPSGLKNHEKYFHNNTETAEKQVSRDAGVSVVGCGQDLARQVHP